MSDLLNQASLVMIPSGYKEDTVFSQLPQDGSGDLSFTRASNGTRINSAGLVEVCPWNLIEYSEQFNNSVWQKINTSSATTPVVTANYTTSPNGVQDADRVQFARTGTTDGTYSLLLSNTCNLTTNGTYTMYVKSLTSSTQNLLVYWGGGQGSVFQVTTEWTRITLSNLSSANQPILFGTRGGTGNYYSGGDLSIDIAVWGAQLNVGTAKPYFPTTDRLNVPRLTYQNGGGGCPSLLLEKQSTNLVTYSEQFDNAFYTKFNSSVSANATTSPDGTTNADKLIANSTNDTHGFYAEILSAAAGTYTQSVFVKAGEYNFACLRLATDSDTKRYSVVLNLTTGAISATDSFGSPTNTSSKVDNLGNGWFRLSITSQHTVGIIYPTFAVSSTAVPTFSSSLPIFTGNGTNGIFIWGAQLEASSYPTSYIPSTSSSATRVADACFKTGISSLIGQTEGTMFVDLVIKNDLSSVNRVISLTESNWLSGGSIRIDIQSTSITAGCVNNNAGIGSAGGNITVTQNSRYKIAFAYIQNDLVLYVNGTQLGTNTSTGAMPTCSEIYLNELGGGFSTSLQPCQFNQAVLFKTRLTNAELASLTTI